jgi:phosphohistidine swiveling domain-containing protein
MGMVMDPTSSGFTGASVALRVLAESRLEGYSDDEILRRSPVVLALVAPKIGSRLELPSSASAESLDYEAPEAATAAVQRESLRLRVRWVQELVGQAAFEIGSRLADRGVIEHPDLVRHLGFHELSDIVAHRAVPDTDELLAEDERCRRPSPGLPARFRMSDRGVPIAVVEHGRTHGGTGAGGGVGRGPVTHDVEDPPPGSVLVVTTLTPQLGPVLDRLAGLVAETGSVLSHLAILARERGVATVVAYPGATDLADGSVVSVDGHTGQVSVDETGREEELVR